jgi:hypothetical protein
MRLPLLFAAAIALMCLAAPPVAANNTRNTDAKTILDQQAGIRTEAMNKKGRYKDMAETKRQELFAHQDKVNRMLEGVGSTTDLPEKDQITVFNSLEAIEAIINQAEDERMVCTRVKPVGSNRPQTVCKTVAQLREEKLDADRAFTRDSR